MSETRWTPDQEAAITAAGSNILVAAAAGSGKTATLVERVIRRLTDTARPLDVDQLLVVTFTEAAAAEMRQRIGAALQKALAADPDNGRLHRQLALLPRAQISTLHSFCLSLIRQYFYRLGLDPSISVMGEHEALLLRAEVLDELFGRRFETDEDGRFLALVERYGGGHGDEGLRSLVLELYDYVQSLPWPEQWLKEAISRFELHDDATIDDLPWWPQLRRQIHLELARAVAALRQAARLAALPGGPGAYLDLLQAEANMVGYAAETQTWDGLALNITSLHFERLPTVKKGQADEFLQGLAKRYRDEAKKAIRGLCDAYFSRKPAEWLTDLRDTAQHLRTLAELVGEFDTAFSAAKAGQASVDFTDLERFALKLLSDPDGAPGEKPSDVARELRTRFGEVLVDEYQDINGVQDAILALVSRDDMDGPANRFMVGDVKQSIYRFRHADPSLFLSKYTGYKAGAAPGVPGRRIILGANFRSRGCVVDGVNFLFRQIMNARTGELDYDEAAELVCKAGFPTLTDETGLPLPEPPVEVHLLDRTAASARVVATADPEATDGEEEATPSPELEELADLSAAEREARLVARRIREMIDGDEGRPPVRVWDKDGGGYRPLRYRDVVVLLRATTGRANTFLDALGREGIPAYAQLATGYFAATEVSVVLSLLAILDNPRQDIPMATVLRSPIIGLSAADLARVRLAARSGTFYDAVVAASRGDDEQGLSDVLRQFVETLQAWRTAVRRRPLSQVLWLLYQETGYLSYVGGMPGGAQRRANLLSLYDRARQFDQFARQGLFRFLRFIDRLKEEEADLGAAPALGEGEDVVRIMSIHKSKGLEFPVVFVADLGKEFGRQDRQGDMLLQRSLGFGPMLVDPERRVKYPTLAHHAVKEAIRLDALAEELRVLYVALTRARERLILVGTAAGLPEKCRRWAAGVEQSGWVLPDSLLDGARTYLDWMVPALMRHHRGVPLRLLAGAGDPADRRVAADPSPWAIRVWDLESLALPGDGPVAPGPAAVSLDWERIGALGVLDGGSTADSAAVAELKRRFSWTYPYAALVSHFAKQTVTELKGHFEPQTDETPAVVAGTAKASVGQLDRRPHFLQETRRALTPTELGTLMHLTMQHLDLTRPLNEADIEAQVASLAEREIMTRSQAAAVDLQTIAWFFRSPLGQRIRRNPEAVRREVAFTLAIPAAEIYANLADTTPDGEKVIVQGMIDLLLETKDGFVLVDYKTDKRDPEEAAQRYRGQIALYRRAVEEILGRPVTEAYLHFLTSDQSIRID